MKLLKLPHRPRLPILFGLSIALAFVHSCTNKEGFVECVDKHKQDVAAAEDAACFLAGRHCRTDSSFSVLELTSAWQRYAGQLNRTWSELEKSQFQRVWHSKSARSPQSTRAVPSSSIPSVDRMSFTPRSSSRTADCLFWRASNRWAASELSTTIGRTTSRQCSGDGGAHSPLSSFAASSSPAKWTVQFRGRVADGLLPMILLLLARSGHNIDRMVYGSLGPSGEFTMQAGPDLGAEKSPAFGVEVVFHRENDLVSRTLYYFSTDLAAGFERDPRLPRFLHRFGACDTLLKSASFLPHWRMCDSIRDYILQNSTLVLQDDTGVPFRDFEASKWHVQLFGAYSHPDPPFQREYQSDLARAFRTNASVRKLGFSLGYGAGRRPSILMLARRKGASPSDRQFSLRQ